MTVQGRVHDRDLTRRRLDILRSVAAVTTATTSSDDVCRQAATVLAAHPDLFPFALLFLVDEAGATARLAAHAGVAPGVPAAPARVSLADESGWPLSEASLTGARLEVRDVERRFGAVLAAGSDGAIQRAIVAPLRQPGPEALGFLVAGLATRDELADAAAELGELVALQLESGLRHARAFAAERRRLEVLATEQRAAAETLKASENRFRTVVRQAATGVVQADASGRMTLVNQRWCQMLGYSEQELLGMNIADVTADLGPTLAAVKRLAEGGPDFVIEKRYRRRDGSLLWASSSVSAVRGPAGEYCGLVAVVVDISEQKRTQELLVEQKNLLEDIAAGQPLDQCLTAVTRAISRLGPSTRACILLADAQRRTFPWAYAANIPASFRLGLKDAAINDLAIGTCGEAVFRGRPVTCPDIVHDERLSRMWRDLCIDHGILACHSEPVIGASGRPLASLMLCFDRPRTPSVWERGLAEFGSHIASIAIERDRAVQAVRDSEERLRLMVESVTDFAIFTTDSEGVVTAWNTGAEAMFGWAESEILGQRAELLFTPEDRAADIPMVELRRARELGRAINERWHLRRDGTTFFASGVVTPLHDARRVGFTKVIRDITTRKQAEDALAVRVLELATLFDVVPIGLCVAEEPDCAVIRMNPAMARLMREPPDRNISLSAPVDTRPVWRVYRGDRELAPEALPVQRAARGETLRDEILVVLADGAQIELEAFAAPLRDASGRPKGSVAAFLDITERTRAEKVRLAAERALKTSEARLRLLDELGEATRAATTPEAIMLATTRLLGEHLGATRCAYADIEVDRNRFASRHVWTAAGATSGAGFHSLDLLGPRLAADLRAGRTWVVRDAARELGPSDGPEAFTATGIQAMICCPLIKGDQVVAMMAVQHDAPRDWTDDEVSEVEEVVGRSWAHMERLRAVAALQEADRRKDEFLATLAHELRNPLSPICNGLGILRNNPVSSAAVRALEMMERQTAHMVRLIDDLLDVSRVSRGKIDLKKERLTLRSALETAVETVRPTVAARGHALIVRLPDESLTLDADPTRISQVVSNLLHNAAKFTPDGGRITLSAERDRDEAVIRVADTGIGIPPDMLPQVFDLFTQVGQTIDRAQGGLGIGLSLAQRLVEMHGGSIVAESPGIGRGSVFTVRLPLVDADADDRATGTLPRPAAPALVRRRILVVDDSVDAAESLGMVLEHLEHEVRLAHDGPSALSTARAFGPEVVFLDIGLPGMDGYEVARAFRADPGLAGATLIALTGYGNAADKARSKATGFDAHLTKPVQVATIEDVLARTRRP